MMEPKKVFLVSFVLGLFFVASWAGAEEPGKPQGAPTDRAATPQKPESSAAKTQSSSQEPNTEATIDRIMEQAVRNIARRYNLNDAQARETDRLMKREVRKFLKEHEKEVWPLIRDLIVAQINGKAPDSKEDVMRIGKSAKPLAKLAQDAIIQANNEWRQFLTADQQKVHDFDMQEMQKTFSQIDKNFSDWESGTPSQGPIIPAGELAGSPPKPKQPPPGLPGPERRFVDTDVFEAIVEKFIKDYEPDPAQVDAARSLLAEAKSKAADFQNSVKSDLEALDRRQNAARANRKNDELATIHAEREKVLEPFHAMVSELEMRLKSLLTTSQIDKHAQRQQNPEAAKEGSIVKQPAVKKRPTGKAVPPAGKPPVSNSEAAPAGETKPKPEPAAEAPTPTESPKPETPKDETPKG